MTPIQKVNQHLEDFWQRQKEREEKRKLVQALAREPLPKHRIMRRSYEQVKLSGDRDIYRTRTGHGFTRVRRAVRR